MTQSTQTAAQPPRVSSSLNPAPPQQMSRAEVQQMLKDPDWYKRLKPEDFGVRLGPVLTEAQFREMQRSKHGHAARVVGRVDLTAGASAPPRPPAGDRPQPA